MKKILGIPLKLGNCTKAFSILIPIILFLVISDLSLENMPVILEEEKNQTEEINEDISSNIRSSAYSPNAEGIGSDFTITLQQSFQDSNLKRITNVSDSSNNTITAEAPYDQTFNSSNMRIEVSDIIAQNKSITVNGQWDTQHKTKYTNLEPAVTSFIAPIDGYLNNISLYSILDAGGSTNTTVVIYNSTWDPINSISLPGDGPPATLANYTELGQYELLKGVLEASWFEILDSNFYLNNSKTENNTWFIGLWREVDIASSQPKWAGVADTGGYPYCYRWDGAEWATTYDHALKLVITSENYISPTPEEVNLMINGSLVIGNPSINGTGYWISTLTLGGVSGKIEFELSSDWWLTSCNITLIQIIYTKTDIEMNSSFYAPESGQDIFWNVSSTGGLNYFDERFNNYEFNFSIPDPWNNINVFNGTTNCTDDISSHSLGDGYKIIRLVGASNGTNWFLNGTSFNLMQSLDTFVGPNPTNTVNSSDIVQFNATFNQNIAQDDGILILEVYNPESISEVLNFTSSISSFQSSTSISITEWNVIENITQCGQFRTQALWTNGTAAGFIENSLTIQGQTELSITDPQNNAEKFENEIFNITIYFNGTSFNAGITGAKINVEVNGSTYSTTVWDLQNGYYKVQIDFNDIIFSTLDWYEIQINVSKHFYNNQSNLISIERIFGDASPPTININTPLSGVFFNSTAPPFNVEVIDSDLDRMWYTLDDGVTNYTFVANGTINQAAWTAQSQGSVTLIFYANDSLGHTNSAQVSINKDSITPSISINSPLADVWFNGTAPDFEVDILDSNLETMWYTLDDGVTNYTFVANGTINQAAWTAHPQGSVTLIFYANDSAGMVNSAQVSINKDSIAPSIIINSPSTDAGFNGTAPDYEIELSDANLDSMWYTLDNGVTNYTFVANGTINQAAWTAHPQGSVTLIFYANDSAGNVNSAQVTINKDSITPSIAIISPSADAWFNGTAPDFEVEIADSNLDSMWYTLDNGVTNYTFVANGTINQAAWTAHPQGSVTLIFYANDSLGNTNLAQVSINKDSVAPSITINSPSADAWFNGTAPDFEVEIADSNLDLMWYTLDNGVTNFTFVANGTINQAAWIAHAQGSINLIFYANDSLGNTNLAQVTINKDSIAPSITINSPSADAWFNGTAPDYEVNFLDSNLDIMWYTIDNGVTNYTFVANGTINQAAWTAHSQGSVTLIFYTNDSLGNTNSAQVIINKDSVAPSIIINSPSADAWFNGTAPNYEIEISDLNLDSMWYTPDNGVTNYTFAANGTINQAAWTAHAQGSVTLIFFANDSLGNMNSAQVSINKDSIAPSITINSPLADAWFNGTAPDYNVEIADSNLDIMWYTLDNGVTNYTFVANGTINQAAWTAHSQGSVTLIFYTNDSLGNTNSAQVIINKDSVAPSIIINSPSADAWFDGTAPDFEVEIADSNLDLMWYTPDNGVTNYTFAANGTINQAAWTAHAQGSVTLIIYANDSLGNTNSAEVTINKDSITPSITINTPIDEQIFSDLAPDYEVEVTDANIENMWYTIDNGVTNYTFVANGTINQAAWTTHSDGIVIFIIYAKDYTGNLASSQVTVNKETGTPIITIINPTTGNIFNGTSPTFYVEIIGDNLDTFWYSTDEGLTNYTFVVNGTINQVAWNIHLDGSVTILFYANNTAGKIGTSQVSITKDTITPSITINSPSSDVWFNGTPPDFEVEIADVNIDLMWYTLDNGATNYTFLANGTINQAAWTAHTQDSVTLIFYANDSFGHTNSAQVSINKDSITPSITINSPFADAWFNGTAPDYEVNILDSNLETMWYTLDNGVTNFTFTANGTINPAAWTAHAQGSVTLIFYANDSLGHTNSAQVSINKDTITPSITINSPFADAWFNGTAPDYEVNILDSNLETMWYTLDNGVTNFTFTANGTINPAAWTAHAQGSITLIFYANDTVGNVNSAQITINKDSIAPSITITTPIDEQIFSDSAPDYEVEITDANIESMWYTIDNGATNYTFVSNGTINQAAWTAHSDGIVSILFFANDSLGNIASLLVSVYKETDTPILNLIYPIMDTIFGGTAPNFNVEVIGENLDTFWYSIDGGFTNFTFISNGTIDQFAWTLHAENAITLRFYANNSAGKIGSAQINIFKDTVQPSIIIDSPSSGTWFDGTAPNYEIEIRDLNLDSMWYHLDKGATNFTFNSNGTINQAAWTTYAQGSVTLIFYANDSVGNTNSAQVTINKDSIAPSIAINSPSADVWFDGTSPDFEVEIADVNLDVMWYTLDNGVSNFTFVANGTINPAAWTAHAQGSVTLIFHANDSLGNTNSAEVTINKDSEAPEIIFFPTSEIEDGNYYNHPPTMNLTISDDFSLGPSYYSVQIKDNPSSEIYLNIIFQDSLKTQEDQAITFNKTLWELLPDGNYQILFWGYDDLNNSNHENPVSWWFIKDNSPPTINVDNSSQNLDFIENYTMEIQIYIKIYTNEALKLSFSDVDLNQIGYAWNNQEYLLFNTTEFLSIDIPNRLGESHLYLYASDFAGNIYLMHLIIDIQPTFLAIFGTSTVLIGFLGVALFIPLRIRAKSRNILRNDPDIYEKMYNIL